MKKTLNVGCGGYESSYRIFAFGWLGLYWGMRPWGCDEMLGVGSRKGGVGYEGVRNGCEMVVFMGKCRLLGSREIRYKVDHYDSVPVFDCS